MFQLRIADEQGDGYETHLDDKKWLAKPLVKAVLAPFLESLKKQRKNDLYAMRHVHGINVDGTMLPLAGGKNDGVNRPAQFYVDAAGGRPVTITLTLSKGEVPDFRKSPGKVNKGEKRVVITFNGKFLPFIEQVAADNYAASPEIAE